MPALNPYLSFRSNAREALDFSPDRRFDQAEDIGTDIHKRLPQVFGRADIWYRSTRKIVPRLVDVRQVKSCIPAVSVAAAMPHPGRVEIADGRNFGLVVDYFRSHSPKQDGLVQIAMHPHTYSVLAVDGDLGSEVNTIAQPVWKADLDPLIHVHQSLRPEFTTAKSE